MAPDSSRPGFRAVLMAGGLIVAVAVAGCATTPPPAAPVIASASPVERAPPVSRPPPPPRPVDLRWTFTSSAASCTALASGPGGSFQIQTNPGRRMLVTAKFTTLSHAAPRRPRPAKLSFTGPAGNWVLAGTWQNRAFTNEQPLDEHGVANILGLLGGGAAVLTAGPLQLGTARLPAASGDGNAWVQCPKQAMAAP